MDPLAVAYILARDSTGYSAPMPAATPSTRRLNDPPNERQAVLCGLAAVVLWSTVATGFKLGLAVMAVEQLLLLGTAISWLVFAAYAAVQGTFRLAVPDRWLCVLLGCINPFAYYLVLFAAYERLPAHIAQPLNYTWAITLALLAVPILRQPLQPRVLLGIVVSYSGVTLLLVTGSHAGEAPISTSGVALALFSTVLWALYWLLNTRAQSAPGALMFWSFTAALPLVALACHIGPGLPRLHAANLGYGAWVGLIEMGVTFILWQLALRRTAHAARMGQLIFLSPFLSFLLIHLVLGERIAPGVIAGLGIIVLGLMFARRG